MMDRQILKCVFIFYVVFQDMFSLFFAFRNAFLPDLPSSYIFAKNTLLLLLCGQIFQPCMFGALMER